MQAHKSFLLAGKQKALFPILFPDWSQHWFQGENTGNLCNILDSLYAYIINVYAWFANLCKLPLHTNQCLERTKQNQSCSLQGDTFSMYWNKNKPEMLI